MIERLLLVVLIFIVIWFFFRFSQIAFSRRKNLALQLEGFEVGSPAILYFSSTDCQPCQTTQRPVITKLKRDLQRRLQIIEIDVYDNPELSSLWGVLSLPTTYLLDSKGIPRHVNHGVVSVDRLRKQLEAIK